MPNDRTFASAGLASTSSASTGTASAPRPGWAAVLTVALLLAALTLPLLPACSTGTTLEGNTDPALLSQKYTYAEVGRRVRDLEPGTSAIEARSYLGSPALVDGPVWVYRNETLPAQTIEVRFEGGRYRSWSKGLRPLPLDRGL